MVLYERQQSERKRDGVLHIPVRRLHRLEIASATARVIPEDVPVHGGEKLETNCVNSKTVPVNKPKRNVVLSDKGQGGENVTARYTRTGRLSKKPNRLDL